MAAAASIVGQRIKLARRTVPGVRNDEVIGVVGAIRGDVCDVLAHKPVHGRVELPTRTARLSIRSIRELRSGDSDSDCSGDEKEAEEEQEAEH